MFLCLTLIKIYQVVKKCLVMGEILKSICLFVLGKLSLLMCFLLLVIY